MSDLEQQLAVYRTGWAAMKWLAKHARNGDCFACAQYRKAIDAGRKPADQVRFRCPIARAKHADYMAVERLIQQHQDQFECFLIDPARKDLLCDGPAEWALVERSRRDGSLLSFQIGCKPHAEFAEARAVVTGGAGTFTVEPLGDVVREGADKMR